MFEVLYHSCLLHGEILMFLPPARLIAGTALMVVGCLSYYKIISHVINITKSTVDNLIYDIYQPANKQLVINV